MENETEGNPLIEIASQERHGPYLIAGLGNPGREFERNRHNVGFMLLNRLCTKLGEKFGKVKSRALVCKATFEGERVILVKPQTYMNNSGTSVSSLVRFYKVPLQNLLVVYDEVDLPQGSIRLRPGGGSAGQKGMQSIIEKLGTEDFPRLRIGMGRPPGKNEAADYVLQNIPDHEKDTIDETLERAADAVLMFIREGIDQAMNHYNGSLN
jgi:PTH1 family peptidyl-tRNA hydrolase